MTSIFADTSFYLAVINPRDEYHAEAVGMLGRITTVMVTTEWVLAELLNTCARDQRNRQRAVALVNHLRFSNAVEVVPVTSPQFEAGFELYLNRMDKQWGVVDCISFQLMWERSIGQALTFDEHFEQAGFERVR
jgi:uncharacterized protein